MKDEPKKKTVEEKTPERSLQAKHHGFAEMEKQRHQQNAGPSLVTGRFMD